MTLVDSNILLDIVTGDAKWLDWSKSQLERAALTGDLVINDVIYAEVSTRYATLEAADAVIREFGLEVIAMPCSALFLAGKAYLKYRSAGGIRTGVLSDFFIGAHAAAAQLPLLTRDVRRYRGYFPTVSLIAPNR